MNSCERSAGRSNIGDVVSSGHTIHQLVIHPSMINQLTSRAAQHHPVRRRADHTTPVGQASHARGTPCAVRPSIGLAPCSRHSWRRSLCPGLPVGRAGPQCTTAPNRNGPIIRIAVPLPCPFTLLIVVPGSQRICIHLHCRAYSPIRSRVTNHQFHTVLLLEWKEHACIGVLPPQCNAGLEPSKQL